MYGHVARFPDVGTANKVLFVRDNLSGKNLVDAHITHGRGKLINPAKNGLVWERRPRGGLLGGTVTAGGAGGLGVK